MNRRIILSAAMAILAAVTLRAQDIHTRYEDALRLNLWNDGSNPAGLRQHMEKGRVADAYLTGAFSNGGFRQSWEADTPWSAGAATHALVHLEKFSMKGAFSFEQEEGDNMCGSMFMRPGYYPLDILEFTPGKKTRQTYSFDGDICVDIADNWRAGAGMQFTSANLAKRKDLRHSNYMLDLNAEAGILWHKGPYALGADLLLRKSSDTPVAQQIGTKETFDAFLDKGLGYGVLETWDGGGLHISEAGVSGFPVNESGFGLGLQMQAGAVFAEASLLHTNGTVGEKQFIWCRFPGNKYSFRIGGSWNRGGYSHSLRGCLEGRVFTNRETVLEKVTEGGVTTVSEHGYNQILERSENAIRAEYSLKNGKSELIVSAKAAETLSRASQMYPYIIDDDLREWSAGASYRRSIGRFEFGAALCAAGGSDKEVQGSSSGNAEAVTSLYRLDTYYQQSVEYRTAERVSAGLSVSWLILGDTYVKLSDNFTKAFNIEHLPGASRNISTLTIGTRF